MEVNKMPYQDGTGPLGIGPMTGRGLGPCGCGMRRGFRGGSRWRQTLATPVTLSKDDQKKILESELKELKIERQAIENKLKDLAK